jgi:hypothetical protein
MSYSHDNLVAFLLGEDINLKVIELMFPPKITPTTTQQFDDWIGNVCVEFE